MPNSCGMHLLNQQPDAMPGPGFKRFALEALSPVSAAAELRQWQEDAPSERVEGYLTLFYARYWAARELYPQAIAQVEQLDCVNPESAYIDRALLLAAQCELKRGRRDRALATLHSLVKQHPGSPLVPEVKQVIARLEAEGTEEKK